MMLFDAVTTFETNEQSKNIADSVAIYTMKSFEGSDSKSLSLSCALIRVTRMDKGYNISQFWPIFVMLHRVYILELMIQYSNAARPIQIR